MSVRRSTRRTKGQSPSRLGESDGWANVAASQWSGTDHKQVEYSEGSDDDDDSPTEQEVEGEQTAEAPSNSTPKLPPSQLISSAESLGPWGIIVLFVVAVLNIGVALYAIMAAMGFEDVRGTPVIYVAAAFSIVGAGLPLWNHFTALLSK
mmetsp:Transcript_28358/g.74459  ORF Transcript_28358/g.74459 Transcript_28358/m.74459 type:complete len:150 (+) Transcript_28358:117-566(+)